MRNIDTETEEYIAHDTTAAPRKPRKPKEGASKEGKSRRPVPDSQGPSVRRAAKAPRREPSYGIIDFFKDYRTHLGFGIFLCLVGIVMAVCCVSFLFSHSADQSLTHGRTISEIAASGEVLEQAGGAFGAKLAEFLLVDTFGIGSFVIAFYLVVISLAVMRFRPVKFFSFTFRCLFTTVALSAIVGLLTYNNANAFHLGGAHGYYMNSLLMYYADALGAYAVMVLLIGLLVAVYFNPVKNFFGLVNAAVAKRRAAKAEAAAAMADDDDSSTAALDSIDNDEEELPEVGDNFDIEVRDDDEADNEENRLAAAATSANDNVPADVPADHLRFLPKAALDDFESHDDDGDDDDSVASAAAPVAPAAALASPAEPAAAIAVPAAPGEPELIIVTKQDDADPSTEEPQQIRHGDHISLDTPYDVRASHQNYKFPPTDLLIDRGDIVEINEAEQQANKKLIVDALLSYNIEIERIEATIGPTVTLYEIVPQKGIRIAKIKSLEDDIAMRLSALGIRIIAPMPGKGTLGIEVPNRKAQTVSMRRVLESKTFTNSKMALPMALGSTISNDIFMADLAKLPHLLVAGATGQGKSVGLNCIITSLLYSKHPDELKFVLVDPKTVEFSLFESIGHQYLAKLPDEEKAVITDPKKVVDTLNSLCVEMENRYKLLSLARVKQISEYNEKFTQRRLNPEEGHAFMPYIVVIVDEYADLVMVAGKEVAPPIARITQKARAVGIHMILATQRPSTDVITGMIKNNFTARIAFKVTQGVDSKTILDRPGAQRLIGRGDMLTMINGVIERVQCAFVDTPEVEEICDYISRQPGFVSCYQLPDPPVEDGGAESTGDIGPVTEEFKRCAMFISTQDQASITMLQRKFEIGFNKAGRFMDQMAQMGIVGPSRGAKPRDVLMSPDDVQRLFE